jgi:L-ornithine N5-oxygenase
MQQIYDIVGVGFGPSNIALAIALEELGTNAQYVFLERAANSLWQGGMLLDGSDIQNNPLRDLVTLRNPQSRYTFINYLKHEGRLFDYLNLGVHYPLRKDYAKYVSWVAEHFSSYVHYGTTVTSVEFVSNVQDDTKLWKITTTANTVYYARCLVLGHGRTPNIPEMFRPFLGDRVFHLNHYLPRIQALSLSEDSRIAVLGSSQSAVEILLDLVNRHSSAKIYSIHRSYSFRLKDTSPFSDHVYFPEFIDYYYEASKESKRDLARQLRPTNYSSADGDVIHQLYLRLYEEKLDNKRRVEILNSTMIESVEGTDRGPVLSLVEVHTGQRRTIQVDAVVLATGFLDFGTGPGGERFPPLLANLKDMLSVDEEGVITVHRDYSVPLKGPDMPLLYLNGLCEATHGLGDAGSFSLVALRAMEIANSVLRSVDLVDRASSDRSLSDAVVLAE